MPLARAFGNPHLSTPSGVQFTMADRSKLIRCLITDRALRKLAGRDVGIEDYERIFLAYREDIELVASRKYDAASVLYVPFEITTSDVVRYRLRLQRERPRRTGFTTAPLAAPDIARPTPEQLPDPVAEGPPSS